MMKKIQFLVDYRGVLTGEAFYEANSVGEFDSITADKLVNEGRAKLYEVKKTQTRKAAPKRRRTRKKAN